MRLVSQTLVGASSALPDPITVDWSAVPDGLVAVVGNNGAGKSHLLEGVPAALYRRWPSYGEPFAAHLCPGSPELVSDVTFDADDGVRYRVRVRYDATADGGRGKTEAFAWIDGGDTAVAGERVGEVDAYLADKVPDLDLFLASNFAAQSHEGSLFEASKSDAKALFLKMLRLERLAEIAAAAAERRRAAEEALGIARAQLVPARAAAERATVLRAGIAVAEEEAGVAQQAATLAVAHLDELTGEQQRVEMEAAAIRQAEQHRHEQRDRLAGAVAQYESELSAARDRVAALAPIVAQADDIRAAHQRHTENTATAAAIDAERERFALDVERMKAEAASGQRWRTELRERIEAAEAVMLEAEQAENRLALLSDERDAAALAERERDQCAAALADARDELAALDRAGAEDRGRWATLKGRDQLRGVDIARDICGVCPLTEQARQAGAELAVLKTRMDERALQMAEQDRAERDCAAALAEAEREVTRLAAAAFNYASAEAVAAKLPAHRQQVESLEEQRRQAEAEATNRETAMRLAAAEIAVRQEALAALRDRIAADAPLATQYGSLATIHEQHAAAESFALRTSNQLDTVRAELAALPADDPAPLAALVRRLEELGIERQAATTLRFSTAAAARAAADRLARLTGELAGVAEQASELNTLQAKEAEAALAVDDWRHLERAFGPDGIQALEIDAAGPTITALANDLLESCFGRRFTVKIVTTEPKARGGGHKEVFDVQLIDAERGRTGKKGSGGEQVILDEAVRLAISIYQGRKSAEHQGAPRCRTLWRDETAGALSPQNASRYVMMLRRARQVGDFAHVIFISHDPRVWRQADTQLYVAGGAVTVGVPAEYSDAVSG